MRKFPIISISRLVLPILLFSLVTSGLRAQWYDGAGTFPGSPTPVESLGTPLETPPGKLPGNQQTNPAEAQDPANLIIDVRAEGNIQIPMSKLNEIIRTRKGRPFKESEVEETKRELMRTLWFIDVKPQVEKTPQGLIVTYRFIERPLLHYVKIRGNKGLTKKRLLEEANLKAGDALDPIAVQQAKEKMETFYRLEGYHGVHIEILRGDRLGDRGAVFLVNEGVKQRVLSVDFKGATIASNSRLQTQIESKPGYFWYLIYGQFTRPLLEADVEKLTEYYRKLGFFYAKVDYEIEETSGYTGLGQSNAWVKITFLIDEGPRCRIRDIRFVGNKLYTDEELKNEVKSRIGKWYYQDMVDIDMARVRDKYGQNGYVFSDSAPDPRIDGDQVDLIVRVKEGPRCRVGEIKMEIIGVDGQEPYTALSTAMNPISFKPGQIMNTLEIEKSKRRLRASGVFNSNPAQGPLPEFTFEIPEEYLADEERRQRDEEEKAVASPNKPNYRGQAPSPIRYLYRYRIPDELPTLTDAAQVAAVPRPDSRPSREEEEKASDALSRFFLIRGPSATPPVPLRHTVYKQPGRHPVVRGQQPQPSYSQGTPSAAVYAPHGTATAPVAAVPATAVPGTAYPASGYAQYPQAAAPTFGSVASPTTGNLGTPAAQPATLDMPVYSNNYPSNYQGNPPATQPAPGTYSPRYPGLPGYQPAPVNPQIAVNPYGNFNNPAGEVGGRTPADLGFAPYDGKPKPLDTTGGLYDSLSKEYDVTVTGVVSETRTGQLMMSVAVNSDSGLMGRFVVEEQNFDALRWPNNPFRVADWRNAFRGKGQVFRIEACPGEYVQRYEFSWQTPYIFNLDYSFGTSGYYYQRFYDEWYEDRIGGTLSLGKRWTKDLTTSLTFNGGRINVYHPIYPAPIDLQKSLGHNDFYTFGLKVEHDTRDNTFLATEGHLLSAGIAQTVGKHQYLSGSVDVRKYFMLRERPDRSGRWVLALRSAAGLTEGDTPIYDRYFAGGFSSLRGFEYRTISPREPGFYGYDENGNPVFDNNPINFSVVGGCFEFYNSAELVFPLTADDMIRGLVFLDTGTVQRSVDKWDEDYRVSAGFGFRLTIPMMGPAPIALDFAFPIVKGKYDREQLFTFNVGFFR